MDFMLTMNRLRNVDFICAGIKIAGGLTSYFHHSCTHIVADPELLEK